LYVSSVPEEHASATAERVNPFGGKGRASKPTSSLSRGAVTVRQRGEDAVVSVVVAGVAPADVVSSASSQPPPRAREEK
jgi:hypothetical protein